MFYSNFMASPHLLHYDAAQRVDHEHNGPTAASRAITVRCKIVQKLVRVREDILLGREQLGIRRQRLAAPGENPRIRNRNGEEVERPIYLDFRLGLRDVVPYLNLQSRGRPVAPGRPDVFSTVQREHCLGSGIAEVALLPQYIPLARVHRSPFISGRLELGVGCTFLQRVLAEDLAERSFAPGRLRGARSLYLAAVLPSLNWMAP